MPSPPLSWIRTSTILPMPSCKPRKSRRPPTNSSEQAGGSSASACRASKLARTFDATLVHAHGEPASCSLPSGAASSETEEDFQRADSPALDFGALHGCHYHLCLHLHPDYDLGFSVSMGHSAH